MSHRQMLYELSEDITSEDLRRAMFLLRNQLPKKLTNMVCGERAKNARGSITETRRKSGERVLAAYGISLLCQHVIGGVDIWAMVYLYQREGGG